MIVTYVDESGTHKDSKVLVVAAYVGTSDEWQSAEGRFKRADKHSGVPFHAVDCAQGGKKFRGMDKGKRYRFYKKIVKIANDHDVFGISSGALLDDYNDVFPLGQQVWEDWLAPLLGLIFQMVMIDTAHYVRTTYPGEKFSVAMEDSEHWYVAAAKKFLRMKHDKTWANSGLLETIAPYSKEEAVQLHAPDALAYESYLHVLRQRIPTKHGEREYLADLLTKPKAGRLLDKTTFETMRDRFQHGTAKLDLHLEEFSSRELSRLNRKQF